MNGNSLNAKRNNEKPDMEDLSIFSERKKPTRGSKTLVYVCVYMYTRD